MMRFFFYSGYAAVHVRNNVQRTELLSTEGIRNVEEALLVIIETEASNTVRAMHIH
jgi:hypothetical protein